MKVFPQKFSLSTGADKGIIEKGGETQKKLKADLTQKFLSGYFMLRRLESVFQAEKKIFFSEILYFF